METLTIYKIKNKYYIKYKPEKVEQPTKIEAISYKGSLYQEIDLKDIDKLFQSSDIEDAW